MVANDHDDEHDKYHVDTHLYYVGSPIEKRFPMILFFSKLSTINRVPNHYNSSTHSRLL
jgi:hypothetical protein